jgi:ABC-type multidrug transport system fused ATPase/permease subunit
VEESERTLISPIGAHLFTTGSIVFKEVSLRYSSNLHTVVSRLSLSINAREKIGIVGRTGSGKSTLLLSLLKMVEVSEGTILVDGKDLADLRPTQVRR